MDCSSHCSVVWALYIKCILLHSQFSVTVLPSAGYMVMALKREWSDQPCKTLLFPLLSTQTTRLKISCMNRIDYIRLTKRRISLTSYFKLPQSQHPPPPPPPHPPTWKMFLETREERNSLHW